jgi:AraC family transcriptional activator of pobA
MRKNKNSIPVNIMYGTSNLGISIDKITIKKSDFTTEPEIETSIHSHRDEGFTFHILKKRGSYH